MRMLTRALAHRWLEAPLPKGKKWKTLVHNGVLFAPPYEPHGIRMRYDGKPVDLPGAFCRRRTLQPHSTLRSSRLFSPPHLSLSLWRTFVRSFVRSFACAADAEELATFYSMYLESLHVKKPIFNKNFFKAFKEVVRC